MGTKAKLLVATVLALVAVGAGWTVWTEFRDRDRAAAQEAAARADPGAELAHMPGSHADASEGPVLTASPATPPKAESLADAGLSIDLAALPAAGPRATRVVGTVVAGPGGRPVIGAVVRAVSDGASLQAQTQADGKYAIEGVTPGLVAVFVAGGGWVSAGWDEGGMNVQSSFATTVKLGTETVVDLVASPAAQLRGVVVDSGGGRIQGAVVTAALDALVGPSIGFDVEAMTIRTDDEGRFAFGSLLPGCVYVLRATEPSLGSSRQERIVASDQALAETRLMIASRDLVVLVVDLDGSPVRGAKVTMHAPADEEILQTATTDTDGQAALTRVPSPAVVSAFAEGFVGIHTVSERPAADGLEGIPWSIEIRLPRAATADTLPHVRRLTVRVRGPDGEPVPRAVIEVRWVDSLLAGEIRDGVGEVLLAGAADDDAISVDVGDARTTTGELLPLGHVRGVAVPPGARTIDIRLPAGFVISGQVLDERGLPIPGILVEAEDPPRDGPPAPRLVEDEGKGPRTARASADGTFSIRGLGEGAYRLVMQAPAEFVMPSPAEARAGDSGVVLVLRRGIRPYVTVLDPSGAPLPGATVGVRRDSGAESNLATDARGRVRLPALDESREHRLSVGPPEARRDLAPWRHSAWRPRDETVRLPRGLSVAGRVLDAAGRPVARANVWLSHGAGSGWIQADAAGRFRFAGVPFGKVELRAAREGASSSGIVPTAGVAGDEEVTLRVTGR